MGENKKKRIWKYIPAVVNKTIETFEGGLKQMWLGKKGILGKQTGEADTAYLKTTER